MSEEEKKPGAGMGLGESQRKIVFGVLAAAVVILAVVSAVKFGFGADLLNPSGGQMSLVRQNVSYKVVTPQFQQTTIPRYRLCPEGTSGCNGTCLNLSFDNRNCGSCGNACNLHSGGFCTEGSCCYPGSDNTCEGVVCKPGLACCRGRCVWGSP